MKALACCPLCWEGGPTHPPPTPCHTTINTEYGGGGVGGGGGCWGGGGVGWANPTINSPVVGGWWGGDIHNPPPYQCPNTGGPSGGVHRPFGRRSDHRWSATAGPGSDPRHVRAFGRRHRARIAANGIGPCGRAPASGPTRGLPLGWEHFVEGLAVRHQPSWYFGLVRACHPNRIVPRWRSAGAAAQRALVGVLQVRSWFAAAAAVAAAPRESPARGTAVVASTDDAKSSSAQCKGIRRRRAGQLGDACVDRSGLFTGPSAAVTRSACHMQ